MINSAWCGLSDALDNMESNAIFLEKVALDDGAPMDLLCPTPKAKSARDCSWVKKRHYKKKLIRRFLTIDPAQDFSKVIGTRCEAAVFWEIKKWEDKNSSRVSPFNPYTKTFKSPRGDIRVYHGKIEDINKNHFNTNRKNRCVKHLKHKRIRSFKVDEDGGLSYGYVKKVCTPNDKID